MLVLFTQICPCTQLAQLFGNTARTFDILAPREGDIPVAMSYVLSIRFHVQLCRALSELFSIMLWSLFDCGSLCVRNGR